MYILAGWYQANYTFSQLSTFGHMAGCDFATGPCLVNGGDLPDANRGFFCNQAGTAACSSDHHWKQACTVLRYAEDPPVQWFDQDSSLGGPQQTDFCPIFSSSYTDPAGVPLSVDCRVASNVPAVNQFK